MTISEELQALHRLHESGVLSADEFAGVKERILNGPLDASTAWAGVADFDVGPEKYDRRTRQWGFLLHISLLAGFLFPLAGLVAPIVIWQLKKDELPEIDAHGKNAINWILSSGIYLVVSALLVLAIIGIPMLIALGLAAIVFPIIAAFKANQGEVWKYPLSIAFFK